MKSDKYFLNNGGTGITFEGQKVRKFILKNFLKISSLIKLKLI